MKWKPISNARFAIAMSGLALLALLYLHDADGYLLGVDDINLAFHEAGHLIFGVLGDTINLYGGTLGQLVFPAAVAFQFVRQAEPLGVFFGTIWFCENLFNIARYAGDARAQVIPLLGGEHDWFAIFNRWGVLRADTAIAGVIRAVGWLGMVAAAVWIFGLWNAVSDPPPPESPPAA